MGSKPHTGFTVQHDSGGSLSCRKFMLMSLKADPQAAGLLPAPGQNKEGHTAPQRNEKGCSFSKYNVNALPSALICKQTPPSSPRLSVQGRRKVAGPRSQPGQHRWWMVSGCQTVEKDAFSKLSGMTQSRYGVRAEGKAQ